MNGRLGLPKLEYFEKTGFMQKIPVHQRLESVLSEPSQAPKLTDSLEKSHQNLDELKLRKCKGALQNKYLTSVLLKRLQKYAAFQQEELEEVEKEERHKKLHERERICQPFRDEIAITEREIRFAEHQIQQYANNVELQQFEKNSMNRHEAIKAIVDKSISGIDQEELLQAINHMHQPFISVPLPEKKALVLAPVKQPVNKTPSLSEQRKPPLDRVHSQPMKATPLMPSLAMKKAELREKRRFSDGAQVVAKIERAGQLPAPLSVDQRFPPLFLKLGQQGGANLLEKPCKDEAIKANQALNRSPGFIFFCAELKK